MSPQSGRGVSDVVGYVLVFSLIAASTGVVYTVGFGGLQESRQAERVENAERAFDVFADNTAAVVQGRAPSRATEVRLADAELSFGSPTTFEVRAGGETVTRELRPIRYDSGDSAVVYEAGAVLRVDRGGAVVNSGPDFVFGQVPAGPDRTVLALPETTAEEERALGGSTTSLVRVSRDETQDDDPAQSELLLTEPSTTAVRLRLTSTPRRAEAWERHLETQVQRAGLALPAGAPAGFTASDQCRVDGPDDARVTCHFETDALRFSTVVLDVRLEE